MKSLDPNEIEDADWFDVGANAANAPNGLYFGAVDIAFHGESGVMMEFIFGIAEFLLQAVILLGVFLLAVAGVLALTQRKRGAGEEGVSRRAPQ